MKFKIFWSFHTFFLQIYSLDPLHHGPDLYLSGTAEMSLAGLLMNTIHHKSNLPLKLTAVSRCYRAETSSVLEERGIYRYVLNCLSMMYQLKCISFFLLSIICLLFPLLYNGLTISPKNEISKYHNIYVL